MASPSRGNAGRFVRTIEGAERDRQAALLRAERLPYHAIAARLGYADESGAYKAVQRAIASAPAEAGAAVKASELEQLDLLAQEAFAALRRVHPVISNGRRFDDLTDEGPIYQAINVLLRIQERRSRLEGLDAPPKSEVPHGDSVDDELERLVALMGSRTEIPATPTPEG